MSLTEAITAQLASDTGMALLLAGLVLASVLLLVLLVLLLRLVARRSAPLQTELARVGGEMAALRDAQSELRGGLTVLAEHSGQSSRALQSGLEARLAELGAGVGERLHGASERTARSLGELQTRLHVIDTAQQNITRLSRDVLKLQDILANKQTRGLFGEIQLQNLLEAALPPDAFSLQATLSNKRRADAVVWLPLPPGPIAIDSKFPLEAYEALLTARSERDPRAEKEAAKSFRDSVRVHLRAVAERYIIEGETADGALMFLPSEAVYAELHANFSEIVREGFERHVWIVSPTTCMAVLTTLRAVLKDARMRRHAADIRKALGLLGNDMRLVADRVEALQRHLSQTEQDLSDILTATKRGTRRAETLERMEFSDDDGEG